MTLSSFSVAHSFPSPVLVCHLLCLKIVAMLMKNFKWLCNANKWKICIFKYELSGQTHTQTDTMCMFIWPSFIECHRQYACILDNSKIRIFRLECTLYIRYRMQLKSTSTSLSIEMNFRIDYFHLDCNETLQFYWTRIWISTSWQKMEDTSIFIWICMFISRFSHESNKYIGLSFSCLLLWDYWNTLIIYSQSVL